MEKFDACGAGSLLFVEFVSMICEGGVQCLAVLCLLV